MINMKGIMNVAPPKPERCISTTDELIQFSHDQVPIGTSAYRALLFLLICVQLRLSVVKPFFNCRVPAASVPHGVTVPTLLFCFALLLPMRTLAQSVVPPAAADWGKSVQGVQLSITLATNVFQLGSSATVESLTRNTSTNDVVVDIFAPTAVFDVLLTNRTGKSYHITTPTAIRGPRQFVVLKPGDKSAEAIPVTFGKTRFGDTVEPGDYTLLATRHFSAATEDYVHEGEGAFKLESNSLKVEVK
jgi:hypothetical protein